ncbi:MAG: ATPase domain-containing protein [Candidatus Altiarchaeota archaeon]
MVNLNERCPSGIPGLDELIEGGYPRGRTILISGTCGTGKTTFAVQFLYAGVKDYNENGIMVTLEQTPEELRRDMLKYGMDLEKYEKQGKLLLLDQDKVSYDFGSITDMLITKAQEINAKRAVVDSLGAMDFASGGKYDMRKTLFNLNKMLKDSGLTTLFVSEISRGSEEISTHGVESYLMDGVIILTLHEALDSRKIEIRKMRATKHSIKSREFEFTDRGIVIIEKEENKPKKAIFL